MWLVVKSWISSMTIAGNDHLGDQRPDKADTLWRSIGISLLIFLIVSRAKNRYFDYTKHENVIFVVFSWLIFLG